MILTAKKFVSYRSSEVATVTGAQRDGTPTARYEVAEHEAGDLFRPPSAAIANDLISRGVAAPTNVTGVRRQRQ